VFSVCTWPPESTGEGKGGGGGPVCICWPRKPRHFGAALNHFSECTGIAKNAHFSQSVFSSAFSSFLQTVIGSINFFPSDCYRLY
jgi:hypothetical protein